ncbi:MAG: rod shape-determining protein MreC [Candidatus Krumholzibacteriota bacterium]|nr:rod shape-determining protein MreC [Candidatus Krumholzibacteriota bacterium]
MQIISFLFDKHLEKSVLALAVSLSVFMLTLGEDSKINAAREISSVLLYLSPVQKMEEYFTDIEDLRIENLKLREAAVSLAHENERLIQFGEERNRLREMLGFRRDSFFKFMPCEVIAKSSNRFHHSVTVDRGSAEGVKAGMAVVGYMGLVGKVTQVFPFSSRILLINNKAISVSCIDKRSRIVGILNWERGNRFNLDFIGSEEDVIPGDTLLTSGLGRVLPKGFPVGTVSRVDKEKTGLSLKVSVSSTADLNTVEELFIVIGGRDWESREILDLLENIKKEEQSADKTTEGNSTDKTTEDKPADKIKE